MSSERPTEAVVVGGSAGSLDSLRAILPKLPKTFPVPVLVVIHLPPDKESVISEVLQQQCELTVREARDKEPLEAGTVYVAPPDYHLLVEQTRTLSLSCDDPQMFSRPSIDVLFESAADAFGGGLAGVLLSGANADGARGLQTIREEGGIALVQSPETAYAPTMPQAALQACPEALSMEPARIAEFLKARCSDGAA